MLQTYFSTQYKHNNESKIIYFNSVFAFGLSSELKNSLKFLLIYAELKKITFKNKDPYFLIELL